MVTRVVFAGCLAAAALGVAGCGSASRAVPFSEVQTVFGKYGCTGCHPGVNPSLDLQPGRSYDNLVGIQALEDPTLYRVVAGDPSKSLLYLKLGGDPATADIPVVGGRMPPRSDPIAEADLATVRDWIVSGAKNEAGKTGGPEVSTPGAPPPAVGDTAFATTQTGSGTISGSVIDQRRRPIAGALVTLLLQGSNLEGGEEHYRVAVTDSAGRFALDKAPNGRFLLKAYGPNTIYVSRIVALEQGEAVEVHFGLPDRSVPNPSISSPVVSGRQLAMTVRGSDLDGNYTLAVNPKAGLVFELHSPGNAPGRWSTTIAKALSGPWVFVAVDQTCNVSRFLAVDG